MNKSYILQNHINKKRAPKCPGLSWPSIKTYVVRLTEKTDKQINGLISLSAKEDLKESKITWTATSKTQNTFYTQNIYNT